MKAQKCLASLLALSFLCLPHGSHAQAFQNLNFESANVVPNDQPNIFSVSQALPGWGVSYGTDEQSQINYDDVSLGATRVTLIGPNDHFGANCIEGNFGVLLQGGTTTTGASLNQTALVPSLTESILFKANMEGPVSVSLGGQNISLLTIGTGPNYTLYGGNIPVSLAGQVEDLEFFAAQGVNSALNLDSIVFSPNLVPEPQTWTLLLFSAVALALKRRQQKT